MINGAKNILFYLCIVIMMHAQLSAQSSLERQLDYANNLFENKLYFDAVTEFKRLKYFDEQKIHEYDCDYKIGLSYKYGGHYDEAIKYFREAESSARSDNEKLDAKFQVIRINILRKTTDRALQLLNEMENDPLSIGVANEINYWRGWAYMLADKWEEASTSFSLVERNHPLRLLANQVDNDKYSVTFAKVISYILPGFGQFYTGHYFSGFMSLAWNGLWGYLTVNSFVEDRAFDGIMTGGLLWLRFYRGNVQNAEKLATEENIKIANKALLYLENNFEGERP